MKGPTQEFIYRRANLLNWTATKSRHVTGSKLKSVDKDKTS